MKSLLITLTVAAIAQLCFAQASPTLDDQLTDLWKQAKYDDLKTLFEQNAAATPPDVAALYCSKFFYVLIKPDKAKALDAMNKLKQIAQATSSDTFKSLVGEEIAEVQAIHEGEYAPTPEILATLQSEFKDEYPLLTFAKGLRRYK